MTYEQMVTIYELGPEYISDGDLWDLRAGLSNYMLTYGLQPDTMAMLEEVDAELDARDE